VNPSKTILAFDTSAAHCAAALLCNGQISHLYESMQKGQAERLIPMLEQVLADAGIGWSDLDALAVGTGPGNFTGVRIAVAAARGLALGLDIPAIGVTRLEAAAQGLPRPITVIEDARRDAVYVQSFGDVAETPRLAAVDAIGKTYPTVTGSAAGPGAIHAAMPLTEAILQIAAARLANPTDHPRPAPFYLRGADAAPPTDAAPVILT